MKFIYMTFKNSLETRMSSLALIVATMPSITARIVF